MFLIINLNPSIDRIYKVANFKTGNIYRSHLIKAQAGGKGINVARASKILGSNPLVTGFIGGYIGEFILHDLEISNISHKFINIQRENRICVILLDTVQDTCTVINEEGPEISSQELAEFLSCQDTIFANTPLVIMSGSIPQKIPSTIYGDLTKTIHKYNGISLVDASKLSLLHAMEARADIIKVNLYEIAELAPSAETIIQNILNNENFSPLNSYCQDLIQQGCANIVVSLGEKGAIWCTKEQTLWAKAPKIKAVNTVGSGDSMTAAIAIELEQQNIQTPTQLESFNREKALISGVAAGTANSLIGGLQFTKEMYQELLEKVVLVKI